MGRSSLITLSALAVVLLFSTEHGMPSVAAKKSHGRPSAASSSASRSRRTTGGPSGSRPRVSQRRKAPVYEEEEEEETEVDDYEDDESSFSAYKEDEDELSEDEEEVEESEEEEDDFLPPPRPKSRKSSAAAGGAGRRPPPRREGPGGGGNPRGARRPPTQNRPPPRRGYDEEGEDDYRPTSSKPRPRSTGGSRPTSRASRGGPPPRGGRPAPRGRAGDRRGPGSVVPYTQHQQPSVFARSLDAIRSSMPDPTTIKEVASNSLNAAKATTSSLSANIYREIKGLTSSELEQVLLKATRPDDSPVKGKHVERLVGVTYQISSRYDIYDAVLRKLWAKMAEKDWRTTVKALYILHRFSADGAPEHAAALKARLRELRRTRDPKRKDKYFNSKQLLSGESTPESAPFRAFLSRYAHYVLLRAQCFGGMFDEISAEPKAVDTSKRRKKSSAPPPTPKPITNTALRAEHLEAAAMLFKAGLACCQLKEGEDCENTAIAAERVASDMIGLTAAVAIALNRVLKAEDLKGGDPALIQKWCELYKKQLLPQTKAMVKKLSTKLDAYGLFLPSRMGTSVAPELLERGLNLQDDEADAAGDEETSITPKRKVSESEETEGTEEEEEGDEDEGEEDDEEPEDASPKKAKKPARSAVVEEEEEEEFDDGDEYEYDDDEYYDDEEE